MAQWSECSGNILNDTSRALVNPVNCVGVMGKGLALQFKQHYPEMFDYYREACCGGYVQVGKVLCYRIATDPLDRYVVNFPTKEHWKDPSHMDYIATGLESLKEWILLKKVETIAIPPIGCGLGGLNWAEVFPLIQEALDPIENLTVNYYPPHGES